MRKRKNSDDEEGSEMDIDGEEKVDQQSNEDASETDEDDDDDENANAATDGSGSQEAGGNPFLDSFYELSSEDARSRAMASQVLLNHCFLGPDANSKDAAYALRRLLNGLCSGRAAARQGNASALSSWLKIAFRLNKMDEIRREASADGTTTATSLLGYIRERLLTSTDPSQISGRRKGSEERDYQFGRLFGITAIVRSNILTPSDSNNVSLEDVLEVSKDLVSDLSELFWLKKWMREPAAHAIATLLKSFYDRKKELKSARKVEKKLISEVLIPKLLAVDSKDRSESSDIRSLMKSYTAEQIALASFIQSQTEFHKDDLPFPLDKPILSSETMSLIGNALGETSAIAPPRAHFVWDCVWSYLTETRGEPKQTKGTQSIPRFLRKECPVGDEESLDVIDTIVKVVVKQNLLRISDAEGDSKAATTSTATTVTGKATHERRSLALTIVKLLAGVPFASSTLGTTQILMEGDAIEHVVLTPEIVRCLFLDVICAGNQSKQTTHILKPLALDVLKSISEFSQEDDEDESTATTENRELGFVRALLKCDIRFDSRTKTSTISDLLGLHKKLDSTTMKKRMKLWDEYLDFLVVQAVAQCKDMTDSDNSAKATGYIEQISSVSKNILRLQPGDGIDAETLRNYKHSTIQKYMRFLMAAGFFNCASIKKEGGSAKSKGGKKRNSGGSSSSLHPAVKMAVQLRECGQDGIPSTIRKVIAARFFSLMSDLVFFSAQQQHHQQGGKEQGDVGKDQKVLSVLSEICNDWKMLVSAGASLYGGDQGKESDEAKETAKEHDSLIRELTKRTETVAKELAEQSESTLLQAKKRCCVGMSILARTSYIHKLLLGVTSEGEDQFDDEDDDVEDEIDQTLDSLDAIADDFLKKDSGDDDDDESNPLLGLAELCANIMSSSLSSGSSNRPAAPKLVREAVKYAWLGGLKLSSELSTDDHTLLDADVTGALLEAVGASRDFDEGEAADGEEDEDDDDDDDDDDSQDGEMSEDSEKDVNFSKVADMVMDDDDNDKMDTDQKDDDGNDLGEESDVELEPGKLQSMLEEDSDADVDAGELEHHEGADAALAKLIKIKQEARKAGRLEREKIEVSNHLRCTYLIELLLSRPDGWNRLSRSTVMQDMIMPLLVRRTRLETELQKLAGGSGTKTGSGEKQALVERLTGLLSTKLCKLKLASMTSAQSHPDVEYTKNLVGAILDVARRSKSNETTSCCNTCLLFVLKSNPNEEARITAASAALGDVVVDWSTKRTSRLGTSLFDSMISQMPRLAQASIGVPLATASRVGRSPFVKVEAFRLLSLLFSVKSESVTVDKSTEKEKTTTAAAANKNADATATVSEDLCKEFFHSIQDAVSDKEMKRVKRVKVVLKALDKFVTTQIPPSTESTLEQLDKVKIVIQEFGDGSGNDGDNDDDNSSKSKNKNKNQSTTLKDICMKLANEIDTKRSGIKSLMEEAAAAAAAQVTAATASANKSQEGGFQTVESKKSKKKKKKKKK